MGTTTYRRKRRRRIKYKNVALALAVLLILILLIVWIFTPKNPDNDEDRPDQPLNTGDVIYDDPPVEEDDGEVHLTTDPTLQSSYIFSYITLTEEDLGKGELVLVNNNIAFKGTVNEEDLMVIREHKNKSYSVKDYSVKVLPVVMDSLNNMMLSFYTEKQNDNVMVISGHRTIEYQQGLYDKELEQTGQLSSSLVAKAGYSEHHTGYVIDFSVYDSKSGSYDDFDGTGDYAWINENCYKFGFINRYPAGKEKLTLIDNEPWHFRYVGPLHAKVITDYDFCLEEYISFLKNYTIETGFLAVTGYDGNSYIIYYVPKSNAETTAVYLPLMPDSENMYPYTISGNNVDGWIVTVNLGGAPVDNTQTAPEADVETAPEAE